MKFSGHESFACRYAWLPKAYRELRKDPTILAREEEAMVALGVGKNMVRSIRFWVEVSGLAAPSPGRGLELTPFARAIFSRDGHDPYLEDRRTSWLLHWKISTFADDPVFAWRYMLGHWPHGEFTRTDAVGAFQRESERLGYRHSEVTLSQHFDVFLHTYLRGRGGVRSEESLDGPLVELELVQQIGDRKTGDSARREPLYAFRREAKPDLTPELFTYCVSEYWNQWHPGEATLTYRDLALAEGSVGQVFKLSEEDVRSRLEALALPGATPFRYQPSAVQGTLHRTGEANEEVLLAAIYGHAAAPVGAQADPEDMR
jgi:hypothetical protein